MFIDYVFTCWSFHKLYLEVAEYNVEQFATVIGRLFDVEARLREHLWYGERRWDQLLLALYREGWRERGARLLAAARQPPELSLRVRMPARGEEG
jgi:RimJ/RimL family protein N-acetyltransferase